MIQEKQERLLVIGAHALDFLWRCGGTIAKYARDGHEVQVINLTYGARGESNGIWKKNPDITEEEVTLRRKEESMQAAKILGANIDFMGWQDHMIENSNEKKLELAEKIKQFRPTIVITHFTQDILNIDHATTASLVLNAVRLAKSSGVMPELPAIPNPRVFMFEPSHPELFGYAPDTFINITDVWDIKAEAMGIVAAQKELVEPYFHRAAYRAQMASKLANDKSIRQAETFKRIFPYVGEKFS